MKFYCHPLIARRGGDDLGCLEPRYSRNGTDIPAGDWNSHQKPQNAGRWLPSLQKKPIKFMTNTESEVHTTWEKQGWVIQRIDQLDRQRNAEPQ